MLMRLSGRLAELDRDVLFSCGRLWGIASDRGHSTPISARSQVRNRRHSVVLLMPSAAAASR
jgi:hypothetical protein